MSRLTLIDEGRIEVMKIPIGQPFIQTDITGIMGCAYKSLGAAFIEMEKRGEIRAIHTIKKRIKYFGNYKTEGIAQGTNIYIRLKDFIPIIHKKTQKSGKLARTKRQKIRLNKAQDLMYQFAIGGNVENVRKHFYEVI